jgi:hypothetical protein
MTITASVGKESAEEILSALVGDGKDLIPLKRLIIERTEGTPFFMEEIVQPSSKKDGEACPVDERG